MRVLKFGGTSVANAERFLRVADILESNARQGQVATVLSAPAKITNHLVAMIEKTIGGQDALPNIADAERIFAELLQGLADAQPAFPLAQLKAFVEQEFAQIKHVLHGISLLGQCPDSVNAALICRGEKLSIAIMAGLLEARGHKVSVINPVEKLLAVGHYLESTVDIAESTRRIAASQIPADHMILMAGFTAGNEKGELVVLGRNGSDYSAAVLAACLRADCCEIWTDVDGVYTCDPRQVPDARLLKSMSYQEAMELSYFGAKVLHPRTIAPIAQFQIPCLIKNTGNPQAPGTLIGASRDEDDLPVKGISNLNNMAMFNVSGPGMKGMVGMAARVFATMSRAGISVVLITQSSSEYSISFCVPQSDCARAKRAMEDEFYLELKEGLLEPLAIMERLAIISVVGDGMRTLRGISAKFFAALARANINIVAIAQGSSERSISVVVSNDDATTGVRVTHQMLFNTDQVIEVFVIGVGGVGGALLEQIKRQQGWLKNKHIDLRVCGVANSQALLTSVHGLNLENWSAELAEAKEPFNLGRLIRLVKEYHLLNPVIVDCTSSQAVADQYADFLREGFHVGYTPANGTVDTTTYKNDTTTGVEVTNQLDQANGGFQYLSRSDWTGTWPTTDGEVSDQISTWGNPINGTDANGNPASYTYYKTISSEDLAKLDSFDSLNTTDPSTLTDELVYGKDNGLGLINMRGLDYNDPKWNDLLDQLTPSDYQTLITQSGYGTAAIKSVDKLSTTDRDAATGLVNYGVDASGNFYFKGNITHCGVIVLAQTYNDDLATHYGENIGDESYYLDVDGWYAPAVNMHRTAFSGRNSEYYSEDPFIGGHIASLECEGVASRGMYVFVKHYAINDQEDHRGDREGQYSIATFLNEQAAREIYLKPFEMCVKSDKVEMNYAKDNGDGTYSNATTEIPSVTGIMTSFNRVGYTWAGGNYNMITGLLRNEWGFHGFIITDNANTGVFMDAGQMIQAGADGKLTNLPTGARYTFNKNDVSDYHYGREAVHNILYTIANSKAMNGGMPGSRYLAKVEPYQKVIYAVDGVCGGLIAVLVILTIFRFRKKKEDNIKTV